MRYGQRNSSKNILKFHINYYHCLHLKKNKKENITKGVQQTNTTLQVSFYLKSKFC